MSQQDLFNQLQADEITHLDYLLRGEDKEEFLDWCASHNQEPDNDAAEFYFDMTDHSELEDPNGEELVVFDLYN